MLLRLSPSGPGHRFDATINMSPAFLASRESKSLNEETKTHERSVSKETAMPLKTSPSLSFHGKNFTVINFSDNKF